MRLPKLIKRQVSLWAVPLIISGVVLFGFTAITQADTPPSASELAEYLKTSQLEVGVDSIEGYQQVYYLYKGNRIFVTGAKYNHTAPSSSGSAIVWQGTLNGFSQIFAFDVLTESLVQITSTGTNQNPTVAGGLVIWENWVNERWGLSYYDGSQVAVLTDGANSAIRASSNGRQIIFAEEQPTGWRAFSYDVPTKQFTLLKEGDEQATAFPAFQPEGSITTDFTQYSN